MYCIPIGTEITLIIIKVTNQIQVFCQSCGDQVTLNWGKIVRQSMLYEVLKMNQVYVIRINKVNVMQLDTSTSIVCQFITLTHN